MRYRKISICAAILAVTSLFAVSPARTANLLATPQLSLEERWDSNVLNSSKDEASDFVSRVTPSLKFTIETLSAKVDLRGGVDFEYYSKHTELNERASMFYDLNTTGPIQFTPRFSVLPLVRFSETNDPVRRNVFTQSPVTGLPPSETVLTARTKARDISGSLQLIYLLTPNVGLEFGGGGAKRTYLDNNAGGVDSDSVSGNASISYRITPRFSSGIYFAAARNTFENDTDSDTYNLGISVKYFLSELYTLDAKAGANYLKETTTTGEDKVTSPFGQVTISYGWKELKVAMLGSYELAGGGSFGVTTHRGTVQLSLSNQFAQRWWWDLSGSYQSNRSIDTPRTEDIATWSANAGLRYQPVKWATLRLAGSTISQRARNSVEGADVDRNAVYFGIDLSNIYKLF